MSVVTITTECDARLTERWAVKVPEGSLLLGDDELHDLLSERLSSGEGIELLEEKPHDEEDREIRSFVTGDREWRAP
jgi:hypothetical protein